MTILDTITAISTATTALKSTHDTVKEFVNEYKGKKTNKGEILEVDIPKHIEVMKPVVIHGTGTGMVRLYSNRQYIRTVYPDKDNKWYTRVYFSKKGKYEIIAYDYYYKVIAYANVS